MRCLVIAFGLILSACAPNMVLVSEHDNVWVKDTNNSVFLYCRSNRTEKSAAPMCFPAAIVDRRSQSVD